MMQSGNYRYRSQVARKLYGQGHEEGRQEGRQEGEATALLEVLDARGLPVSQNARRRILACTNRAELKRWLRRAVRVASVNELFGPRPSSARITR